MSKLHVAIIMDGNGRWANARGLPRVAGHRTGADAVRRTVEAAPGLGVSVLTLYAFSADNWRRPAREVSALMKLLGHYLVRETDRCIENGVRLQAIGRRDRLPPALVSLLEEAEGRTAQGSNLHLRLAIDYSSRQAILDAVRRDRAHTAEAFSKALGPDVDLLIRTSGEQRLSDFLLWECAYAEMIFTRRLWPDFSEDDLAAAIDEYHRRDRRFGAVAAEKTLRTA
ncbi:MAG TPA: di-trans,poly-cis-decaprenylcistransferase [Bryobacteraceae bacterium]|jgi:undecaprenyl diphosphate synthase|nr:di-trans,poly-cis-decaprenylcistransferase [Bryobacteraceae bacterium]